MTTLAKALEAIRRLAVLAHNEREERERDDYYMERRARLRATIEEALKHRAAVYDGPRCAELYESDLVEQHLGIREGRALLRLDMSIIEPALREQGIIVGEGTQSSLLFEWLAETK